MSAPFLPIASAAALVFDEGLVVAAARFDEQNPMAPAGVQPVGHHTTRRTGADDDVVEILIFRMGRNVHSAISLGMPAIYLTALIGKLSRVL